MSYLKNYQLPPDLLAYKFEYEGKQMTLAEIITERGGFASFLTWAIDGKLSGFAEVRMELSRSKRAVAAKGNQRSKGGQVGRMWKQNKSRTPD